MIGTLGRLFNPARSLHNWVDERNARQAAERASAEQAAWNAQLQSIADQQEWGGRFERASQKAGAAGVRQLHPCGLYVNRGELENASPRQVVEWAEGRA